MRSLRPATLSIALLALVLLPTAASANTRRTTPSRTVLEGRASVTKVVAKPYSCKLNVPTLEANAYAGDAGSAFVLGGAHMTGTCMVKNRVKGLAWTALAMMLFERSRGDIKPEEMTQSQLLLEDLHRNVKADVGTTGRITSTEESRDMQRRSDVNTILNAIYQYAIDHNGEWPAGIASIPTEICTAKTAKECVGKLDLNVLLGNYIVAIPKDPLYKGTNGSRYFVSASSTGRVTVSAPDTEGDTVMSVTR